ncbi:hypothetical protein JAGODDHD_02131 [Sphingomonas paucimobilis]|nr:hypothetical protein [Sphingomonas paucimobilis]
MRIDTSVRNYGMPASGRKPPCPAAEEAQDQTSIIPFLPPNFRGFFITAFWTL